MSRRINANARIDELRRKEDLKDDKPGLFSKTKRIAIISTILDIHQSYSWDQLNEYLENPFKKPGPLWIDFQGMDADDMSLVTKRFKLHPLTVEDCLHLDTREKLEIFDDYFFVVANEVHYMEYSNVLNNINVCIVIYADTILTFHASPLQCFDEVVRKMEFQVGRDIASTDWLMYSLLDGIIDLYMMLVDQLVKEAEVLDSLVLVLSGVDQTELLERIGYANRHAGHIKSGLWSKREILQALRTTDRISKSVALYLQNVTDHAVRCNQKLKLAMETLGSLNSVYLTKVSVELAVASNRMNTVMRRLASVGAIFLPLTLIAGIFGMNVRVPGMIGFPDSPNGYGWFIGIMLFMVALAFLIASFFKKQKWL